VGGVRAVSLTGNVPESVSRDELERLVAMVGDSRLWDFSRVRMVRDPEPWDYEEVVRRYLRPGDRVLDVGTAGGELFLRLADAFGTGVGVDVDPAAVAAARQNLPDSQSSRIRFEVTARTELAFEPDSFDVVLNRHASINPNAVVRVLRPGGWFIAEGIGDRKNEQILEAFGWDREDLRRLAIDDNDLPVGMQALGQALERLGCQIVATGDESNRAWFCDLESLVFYLKAITLPEAFDPSRHLELFNRYLATNAGPSGYEATEHGNLLIVRKPD
jgi:SAM-dependent methyltransferase